MTWGCPNAISFVTALFMVSVACSSDAPSSSGANSPAEIPPEQAEAFEDDRIDFEEYEAALTRVVECINEAGFEATAPEPEADPRYLSYTASAPEEEFALLESTKTDCEDTYSGQIELVWAEVNAPTESESDAVYRAALDCVEDETGDDLADVDHTDPQSLTAIVEQYGDVYSECLAGVFQEP